MVLTNTGIFFAQCKTMQRKQNLASALGIQKPKNVSDFSEIIKLQCGKKCHTLLCILLPFFLAFLNYCC